MLSTNKPRDVTDCEKYNPTFALSQEIKTWIYKNFKKGDITLVPFGKALRKCYAHRHVSYGLCN